MRTQAHRIVDTDPKRGNVVVRVTGTRHDEPTYQVRQSLPNTQEVPGHDHHTNRVRETGSGSHWGCPALTDRAGGSVRLPA
jgi:hypothetical protein